MIPDCCTSWGRRPHLRGTSTSRRLSKGAASLLPGAALILLPKCPLCLAAWIAATTGIALPATVTGSIRPSLIVACLLSATLLLRRARTRC